MVTELNFLLTETRNPYNIVPSEKKQRQELSDIVLKNLFDAQMFA